MTQTSQDRLLHLLKSRGPQTAGDAGAALGISAPGAQQHLARLAEAGLVETEDVRHGRGRPRRLWKLTEKALSRFPDRHSDLTLDLIEATRTIFGTEGLDRLIRHREQTMLEAYRDELSACSTIRDRVARLAEIRSREGYMAEWGESDAGSFLLVENHCPICAAATICQGLCRSELEVFRAVLGDDVAVERTDHVLAGARRCAYRIRDVELE